MRSLISAFGWSSLGLYRGIDCYNYNYGKNLKKYENSVKMNNLLQKPQYFYLDCISSGFFGVFLFVFPVTLPFAVYKECKRAEINIRKIKDDIILDEYHDIL